MTHSLGLLTAGLPSRAWAWGRRRGLGRVGALQARARGRPVRSAAAAPASWPISGGQPDERLPDPRSASRGGLHDRARRPRSDAANLEEPLVEKLVEFNGL